jgi:hypothetical protein
MRSDLRSSIHSWSLVARSLASLWSVDRLRSDTSFNSSKRSCNEDVVVDVEMIEGVGYDLDHLPKMLLPPLDPGDETAEGAIECVMDMMESTGESGRDKPS